MSSFVVYLLLLLALVIPVLGAIGLRLFADRLTTLQALGSAAALVGVASVSVLVLAQSDVSRLQIGNLNLLLPVADTRTENVANLPAELEQPNLVVPDVPPTLIPTATPDITPTATATAAPTATATAAPTATATAAPEPEPAPEDLVARFVVSGVGETGLRVRSEPSPEGDVLAELPNGAEVEQIGEDVEGADFVWRNVRTAEGVEGWVAIDWLEPA